MPSQRVVPVQLLRLPLALRSCSDQQVLLRVVRWRAAAVTAHDEELKGQLHEQVTSLEQKMVEQADVRTKASHAQAVALQALQEEPPPVGTVLPNVDEVQPLHQL